MIQQGTSSLLTATATVLELSLQARRSNMRFGCLIGVMLALLAVYTVGSKLPPGSEGQSSRVLAGLGITSTRATASDCFCVRLRTTVMMLSRRYRSAGLP